MARNSRHMAAKDRAFNRFHTGVDTADFGRAAAEREPITVRVNPPKLNRYGEMSAAEFNALIQAALKKEAE